MSARTSSTLVHINNFYCKQILKSISFLLDVLNRFPNDARHVLKYIFPRQFNLHNVFTSEVDKKETIQRHKDYTLREQEIACLKSKQKQGREIPIPKRLKGKPLELVVKLQKLHRNCPYNALLKYYCPSTVSLYGNIEVFN